MGSSRWPILKHEQLEELCVLAAAGDVEPTELEQVRAHLGECASCRVLFADIGDIYAIHLAHISSSETELGPERESRIKNSILVSARKEGAHFSEPFESPTQYEKPEMKLIGRLQGIRGWFIGAPLCVLGASLALALALRQTHGVHRDTPTGATQVASTSVRPSWGARTQEIPNRDEELLRGRVGSLEAERSRLERLLQESRSENVKLQNDNSERQQQLTALSNELDGVRTAEAKALQTLEQLKIDQETDLSAITAQNREIRSLNEKLEDKTAREDQAHEVVQAERGLRELVGARNLHIVDVYDTDSQGRTKRAVGRVFYTEGKSLVFYAYDLSTGHSESSKYAYYVWGNKNGNLENVRNLGTLDTDDLLQKRWKLQVEDAKVLADIDRVFVTIEPVGKLGPRPRGKKILSAYLGSPANHP